MEYPQTSARRMTFLLGHRFNPYFPESTLTVPLNFLSVEKVVHPNSWKKTSITPT